MSNFWNNRRVLVTGHTGFKGAWLTLWLRIHGANVSGIALEPEQSPGLLGRFALSREIDHHIVDIRDSAKLRQAIVQIQPEIVFHLAAQALVRRSYQQPADTWNVNVTGTIHLMDSLLQLDSPFVAVIVTSDKVYQNREWEHGYRETDSLGGHDPYSSSKAAVEIAVASWRQSFFTNPLDGAIATARAGNVLGGGDWSEDRIFPDIVRSFAGNHELGIRNPAATRPWQHVVEPLSGYMRLAEQMKVAQHSGDVQRLSELCSAWNFGPLPESNRTVQQLVETATEFCPGCWSDQSQHDAPHEARFLGLSIDKACRSLGWYPRWTFHECVRQTMDWYQRVQKGEDARRIAEADPGIRVQFTDLEIPGVVRIDLDKIEDERGFFARMFCRNEMSEHGLDARIVQCNNSLTRQIGTVRGMHFQRPPNAESKMVRCIRGAVFDVAVDLRAGSATYGRWCSLQLDDQNRSMVSIPPGCAHGFQTLKPDTELLYFHSEFYSAVDEGGLDPLDPAVAIAWPLPVQAMSARDRQHPFLSELEAIRL